MTASLDGDLSGKVLSLRPFARVARLGCRTAFRNDRAAALTAGRRLLAKQQSARRIVQGPARAASRLSLCRANPAAWRSR